MDLSDLFWNASLEEMKKGYIKKDGSLICLLCGKEIECEVVYSDDGILYEAERYMRVHITKAHGSVFEYLIKLDKKFTGLTDHQNSLLHLFYQGMSDESIKKEMDIGSAVTIRNHRFILKEKERQAKVFLTMMELLKEKDNHAPVFLNIHKTANMIDDRYNVTVEEIEKINKKYFPDGTGTKLRSFPKKQKQKMVVLREISKQFENDKKYTEKEVNLILKPIYDDYITIRRYLIDYGFMDRKPGGSEYWLK